MLTTLLRRIGTAHVIVGNIIDWSRQALQLWRGSSSQTGE